MNSRSTSQAVTAVERMRRLGIHLAATAEEVADRQGLALAACSGSMKLEFDAQSLVEYMRGKHMGVQEKVYEYFLSKPELQTPVEIRKDDHRELCMRQLLGLVREAGIRPFK